MREIKLHTGLVVPERVITTLNEVAHQDVTPNWLSSLPTVIEALCAKWQIELEPIIGDTWITVVLFGTSPELGPVVIKSSPNVVDFVAQAGAFEIGAGDNIPRLYDLDLKHCTMVMERIVPGTELRHVAMDDEASTRIGAETLRTWLYLTIWNAAAKRPCANAWNGSGDSHTSTTRMPPSIGPSR